MIITLLEVSYPLPLLKIIFLLYVSSLEGMAPDPTWLQLTRVNLENAIKAPGTPEPVEVAEAVWAGGIVAVSCCFYMYM